MSNRQKPFPDTETDMMYNLLADPTKLKPETKTINIEKIEEEGSDDSDLHNDLNKTRVSHKTFTSSDSSKSSMSTTSRRRSSHGTRSSTSSSSGRRRKHSTSSSSHSDVDKYVNQFNNMDTDRDKGRTEKDRDRSRTDKPEEQYIPKYTTEREKKFYIMSMIFALEDLEERGIKLTKKYTIHSDIEDMEDELRLQSEREQKKHAIVMGKDGLLKITQWLEKGNKYFDPLGLKLNGWHNQMCGTINNYDPVMGRLHDKYKKYLSKVEPEMELIWLFGGSALSFHYSQKFVEDHKLEDIVKKNPGVLDRIRSFVDDTLASNLGSGVAAVEEKPELSRNEMYRRLQATKPDEEKPDKEADPQADVNNTINQLMNTQTQFVAPPRQQRPINIARPRQLNQLLAATNKNNVISLNTETSAVHVETVDSESVADTGVTATQRRLRNRITVNR